MSNAMMAIGLVITLLAQPHTALTQEAAQPQDWATVKAVPIGDELRVKLKNGKTVKGKLSSTSDTGLTLYRDNRSTTVMREDTLQVHRVIRKAAIAKYALIGAGVGAGAGTLAGTVKYSPLRDDSEIFIGLGLIIGAGIGALVGMGGGISRRKRVLIYQAK